MKRETKQDKLQFQEYTTPENEIRYAKHMLIGAKKHGSENWKKGGYGLLNWCKSLRRHVLAMEFIAMGLPVPPELGEPGEDHAAAARFNIEGFMHEESSVQREKLQQSTSYISNTTPEPSEP